MKLEMLSSRTHSNPSTKISPENFDALNLEIATPENNTTEESYLELNAENLSKLSLKIKKSSLCERVCCLFSLYKKPLNSSIVPLNHSISEEAEAASSPTRP